MREIDVKVQVKLPEAGESKKLEDRSLVSYIYVGKPLPVFQDKYGTEPMIQLNDKFESLSGIVPYIDAKKESLSEADISRMIVSIKADAGTKMGIISDIKEELRKVSALNIIYATKKEGKGRD
jgi:hypothetical protein